MVAMQFSTGWNHRLVLNHWNFSMRSLFYFLQPEAQLPLDLDDLCRESKITVSSFSICCCSCYSLEMMMLSNFVTFVIVMWNVKFVLVMLLQVWKVKNKNKRKEKQKQKIYMEKRCMTVVAFSTGRFCSSVQKSADRGAFDMNCTSSPATLHALFMQPSSELLQ